MKYAYSIIILLGDSGPWQLLNVSITRRFHTLVIFLFFHSTFPVLDVSRLQFYNIEFDMSLPDFNQDQQINN